LPVVCFTAAFYVTHETPEGGKMNKAAILKITKLNDAQTVKISRNLPGSRLISLKKTKTRTGAITIKYWLPCAFKEMKTIAKIKRCT